MANYLDIEYRSKILKLFKEDYFSILLILAIAAVLSGLGFVFDNTQDSNYAAIIKFAPAYVWAIAFFIYGFEKILQIFFDIPTSIRAFNSLFGMWLWNYIILSFLFFDKSTSFPLEYIVVAPLLIEVWFLASLIHNVNERKETKC